MRLNAIVFIALLSACAAQPPARPTHVRPASPARPQILAALLDGGTSTPFRFETVHLIEPAEIVASQTRIPSARAVERIKGSGAKRILFFLTGFDTAFAHGASDAARIAQIVDPQTLVVYTDWGSRGKKSAYRRDGKSARRNGPAFEQLLAYTNAKLPGVDIDVFAHSMGSRVAIAGLAPPPHGSAPVVKHLILAAPDLSVKDYITAMKHLKGISRGTVYVSRRDKALLASMLLHFHHRLGQVAVERLNLPRTDIVDVTTIDHSKDGHGYAIHDPQILRDIYLIVAGRHAPHRNWCASKIFADVWDYCKTSV